MRVRLCPELEAWILSFGEEAEVLGPEELRTRIATRATALSGIYSGGVPRTDAHPSLRKAAASKGMKRASGR
jgi:hypothetical protein